MPPERIASGPALAPGGCCGAWAPRGCSRPARARCWRPAAAWRARTRLGLRRAPTGRPANHPKKAFCDADRLATGRSTSTRASSRTSTAATTRRSSTSRTSTTTRSSSRRSARSSRATAPSAATSSSSPTGWPAAGSTRASPSRWTRPTCPTPRNLVDTLKSPPFDPERNYTLPWQSGMSAIGYDPDAHGPQADERQRPVRPQVQGPRVDALATGATPPASSCSRRARTPKSAAKDDYLAGDREDRRGEPQGPDPPLHRQRLRQGPGLGRPLGLRRLLGRHRPAQGRQPAPGVPRPRGGRAALVGQHGHPQGRQGALRGRGRG